MLMDEFQISEGSAYDLVGLSKTTWRHLPIPRDDKAPMRAEVIRLASTYGRYSYRTTACLMRNTGWLTATSAKGCSYLTKRRTGGSTRAAAKGSAKVKRWKLNATHCHTFQSCLEL